MNLLFIHLMSYTITNMSVNHILISLQIQKIE